MDKTIIVFDVETTGLPPRPSRYKRYPDPKTEFAHFNGARVIELAYVMYAYNKDTQERTCVRAVSHLISPCGVFSIENTHIHGIMQQTAEKHGKPAMDVFSEFLEAVSQSDRLVAHNLEFDLCLTLAECYRIGLDVSPLLNVKKTCTMKCSIDMFCLDKYPKLTDMYGRFFPDDKWVQNHRALDDVDKCADVYFELLRFHRETRLKCIPS